MSALTAWAAGKFSATTGKTLSHSEVFAAYGLSETAGRDKIRTALNLYWESYMGRIPEEIREISQDCKDRTLADNNVAAWTPYIDASGNLCFIGTIYSIAGAESYEHLLDQNGNDLSLSCSIH